MTSGDSDRSKRKRGIVLTSQGIQKLRTAITHLENEENFGQKLTIAELGFRTRLTPDTVAKVLNTEQGVDYRTLDSFFRTLNLELGESDYIRADLRCIPPLVATPPQPATVQIDWGEAPDASIFYGRTQELETLTQWVQVDRCRVINLLGLGGIGKTTLVATLIDRLAKRQNSSAPAFEHIIWRSLRHEPSVDEILSDLLQVLSNSPALTLPHTLNQTISQLMKILQQRRCLLVLDSVEAILQSKERSGCYRDGFEGYGELIRRMGESGHSSCLILTSREQSHEIRLLEGKDYPVRSHLLKGLLPQDGLNILQAEGIAATDADHQALLELYAGNPLLLKMATSTIHSLFMGNVAHFLAQEALTFGHIYDLLDHQFERLSALEKTVMHWLAHQGKSVLLPSVIATFVPSVSRQKLLGVLESLRWRSLLDCTSSGITVSPVIVDYVTSQTVDPTTSLELC
ncbi:transcriptional regulator [filamentous cyanobacterium CCP3]|nr:transcriptional regulator [filamentous cyanobacterium CCP3]